MKTTKKYGLTTTQAYAVWNEDQQEIMDVASNKDHWEPHQLMKREKVVEVTVTINGGQI